MKGGNKVTWIYRLTLAPGEGVLPYMVYTGISGAEQGMVFDPSVLKSI